jgi:hypothetical protein
MKQWLIKHMKSYAHQTSHSLPEAVAKVYILAFVGWLENKKQVF